MSRRSRIVLYCAAATLMTIALVAADVSARGGGRGGGGGGRGGGGFSRGGPAARGSFGRNQPARGNYRGYNRRGPAMDGNFGERQDLRQERREERQEGRDDSWQDNEQDVGERRENWQEFVDDHYDDYDGGEYYYDTGVVYWELPCRPNVIAMGGVTYYTCATTWYIRAYSDGEVVYTEVPNPTGH